MRVRRRIHGMPVRQRVDGMRYMAEEGVKDIGLMQQGVGALGAKKNGENDDREMDDDE